MYDLSSLVDGHRAEYEYVELGAILLRAITTSGVIPLLDQVKEEYTTLFYVRVDGETEGQFLSRSDSDAKIRDASKARRPFALVAYDISSYTYLDSLIKTVGAWESNEVSDDSGTIRVWDYDPFSDPNVTEDEGDKDTGLMALALSGGGRLKRNQREQSLGRKSTSPERGERKGVKGKG